MADTTAYRLVTLRDVWEQVPAEKIRECLTELGAAIALARGTADMLSSGPEMANAMCPKHFDWIDDGKGRIGAEFVTTDGETLLSVAPRKEAT